jgi:hypothetical protein
MKKNTEVMVLLLTQIVIDEISTPNRHHKCYVNQTNLNEKAVIQVYVL